MLHPSGLGRRQGNVVGMAVADAAWAAGFFDGEGHIGISHRPRQRRFVLRIIVVNTDISALQKLRLLFGFGAVHARPRRDAERHRQAYHWQLGAKAAESFLKTVLPYLTVKRRQAEIALEFRGLGQNEPFKAITQEVYSKMLSLEDGLRQLNSRGLK